MEPLATKLEPLATNVTYWLSHDGLLLEIQILPGSQQNFAKSTSKRLSSVPTFTLFTSYTA